jgi:hypothetical protein
MFQFFQMGLYLSWNVPLNFNIFTACTPCLSSIAAMQEFCIDCRRDKINEVGVSEDMRFITFKTCSN